MILRDLKTIETGAGDSIRVCMSRIGSSPYLFQLVLDSSGVLVGVVTDGDIRRAIVSGANIDENVLVCVNRKPLVARSVAEATSLLGLVGTRPPTWIPVLDEEGRPECVVVDLPGGNGRIEAALVMAGGFGKRLGAMTKQVPKPLLPINGRPILEHILRALEQDGVSTTFVSTHYLSDQVAQFVETLDLGLNIQLIEEKVPLGTAGALGLIADRLDGPVLVVNGDVLTNTDLGALAETHAAMKNSITVAATRHQVTVPYGVLRCDEQGYVQRIDEKPLLDFPISAGIYLVDAAAARLVARDEETGMPDLIDRAIASGMNVGVFGVHEYWIDVGQPDDFASAERDHDSWRR